MMNTTNQSAYRAKFSKCVLICGAAILGAAVLATAQTQTVKLEPQSPTVKPSPQSQAIKPEPHSATVKPAAQSQATKPEPQASPNNRPRPATVKSSNSADGSRISITSDHSLSAYESYRRGDRFYVKVPASNLPRLEGVRGFTDMKSQRDGDGTLLSFRLQPGANAHVEQRANKLDLVFALPGRSSSPAANPSSDVTRENDRVNRATAKSSPAPARLGVTDNVKNETARASSSPAAKASLAASSPAAVSIRTASPANSPTVAAAQTNVPAQTAWAGAKERFRYWTVWAQLNWIPLAIVAAAVIVSGLFLIQRRRFRGAVRAGKPAPAVKKPAEAAESEATVVASASEPIPVADEEAIPEPVIAAAPAIVKSNLEAPTARAVSPRNDRAAAVSEQMKRLLSGEKYDPAIIASDDHETRRLVSAELLAALVGRSELRREQAREAFMQHGYFDDATRDLRIAGSPHERAAAARRLSFVRDREATPHLIAALEDFDPDVRRTAVEALMDLRDPAAIPPLNSLLQTETDRKVSRTLIKHAIDSCATGEPASASAPPASLPDFSSRPVETEREVIEL